MFKGIKLISWLDLIKKTSFDIATLYLKHILLWMLKKS